MQSKLIYKGLIIYVLSLGLMINTAQAAIIDTANDSFIDTETGLEWMDFGINNIHSYDFITTQLGAGGEYEDWRLPTYDEVYTMWFNVAMFDHVEADTEFYEDNYLYGEDAAADSVWENVFDTIGHNVLIDDFDGSYFLTAGLFEGTDGLSELIYRDREEGHDMILFNDAANYDFHRPLVQLTTSTVLVSVNSSPVEVPEPNLMLLFAGLVGLLLKRR